MRNLNQQCHFLLFFLPVILMAACKSEPTTHPCDTCRPCEECVQDESTGAATCQPTSHALQRCVGLQVVWFNSCDESEEIATTCTNNMICQELDGDASCACRNLWTGDDCDECPEGVDSLTDCTVCLASYDPLTNCQSCIGNRDIETECTECLNRWSGDNCDICPEGFDEGSGCLECRNHWRGGECNECPVNFTIESDCTECANRWTGENCDVCPEQFAPNTNCNGCKGDGHWTGDACDICPANFTVESDCTECATNWQGGGCTECPPQFTVASNCSECSGHYTGEDCSICPPNFTEGSQCTECLNHWEGENCDVCPPGFTADSNCAQCLNHWSGDNCDVCPAQFTLESNCSECVDGRTGSNCDECIGNWIGASCDVCPDNFTIESGCTECANHWAGLLCDECPDNYDASNNCNGCANRWEGDNCDVCPENWDTDFNCALCANHWSGLDCEVCIGSYTAESNCLECANHYTGSGCNECPDNFTTQSDCSECAGNWTGDDCDICPANFSAADNCSECATNWTGANCDVCPNHWAGANCDVCPVIFTQASNCLDCANGWTGDDCDECPNHWSGDACDICPSGFGGDDCDEVAQVCVRYVDGDSSAVAPTGLSWPAAFTDIQSGIESAAAAMAADGGTECEVWLRELSTWYTVSTESDPTATIDLPSGIVLRGGFDGTETSIDQRVAGARTDIHCYAADDGSLAPVNICITADNVTNVTLDSITVSQGIVGILVENSTLAMDNVVVALFENDALFDRKGASTVIRNSTVTANSYHITTATADEGCAIHATDSTVTLNNFTSMHNRPGVRGGAVFAENSSITIDNPSSGEFISANPYAPTHGASIYATGSTLQIRNLNIRQSISVADTVTGGHIYMSDCIYDFDSVTFGALTLFSETQRHWGAFVASFNSAGTIRNCTTTVMSVPCSNGVFYAVNSDMVLLNNDFSGLKYSDTCENSGVIYVDNPDSGSVSAANNIFWDLDDTQVAYETAATSTAAEITYSIVEGGYPGAGNIDVPYVTGDELDLDADFPGIDAGNGDVAPEFDRDGNPRVDVAGVANTGTGTPDYTDIGAYEYQP